MLVTNDGESVPCYISIGKVHVAKGNDIFFLVATDLTEVKLIEEIVSMADCSFNPAAP